MNAAVEAGGERPRSLADPLDRRRGRWFAGYKWAMGLLIGTVGLALYEVIGALDLPRSTTLLDTPLDRAIPFLVWTTWFYGPFYIGVFVVAVAGFRSRVLFHRALLCVAANSIVGALVHVVIPAAYARPSLPVPSPDLSTAFLAVVHRIDPPGNVFPSLHVAQTFAVAFLLRRDRPRLGTLTLAMATVLAISTLTTKQHFVADVAAGVLMALAGRFLALRTLPATH